MKCVCFLQGSEDSLEALEVELREPKYGEYYLCQSVSLRLKHGDLLTPSYSDFSNILSKTAIERLAEADEYEVVKEVQVIFSNCCRLWWESHLGAKEYFADYAPLLPSLFSLNHMPTPAKPLYGSTPNSWDPKALDRSVEGIIAVLLSLKKKPIIRYEKLSGMAKKLGLEIQVCEIMLLTNNDDDPS
jgi:hypothetical protein